MAAKGRPLPEDATAQTLNYALSNIGGRRKSWMTVPSNAPLLPPPPPPPPAIPAQLSTTPLPFTVRQHGRSRKQRAHVSHSRPKSSGTTPQIPLHTRPTVETAPRPLSNSGSPHLPNVVAPQNSATYGPSVAHVFPSPTPSEETFAHAPPHESARRKRPGEGLVQQAEKRQRRQVDAQDQPTSVANAINASPNLPRPPSGQHPQIGSLVLEQINNHSPSPGMIQSQYIPQGIWFQDPPLITTPPQPHALSIPPQTHAPPMPPQTTAQAHSSSHGWYATTDCLQILNSFQASHPPSQDHSLDGIRLHVLRDVIEHEDWFFLTMHQYYCLLTHASQVLPDSLKTLPNLQQAQTILNVVLASNDHLSPSYLHFFSNFPYSIQQIAAKWPAKFRHQAYLFKQFIVHSQDFDRLRTICQRRRCPPLAQELAVDLHIASPVFQRLLFSAVLRASWIPRFETPRFNIFEAQALAIFLQNQNDYHQRRSYHVAGSLEYYQQEKNYEAQRWGTKFRTLIEGYQASLQEQRPSFADIHNDVSQPEQQVPVAPLHHPQHVQSTSSITNTNAMPPRPNRSVDPHSAQAAIQQSPGRGRPPARPAQPATVSPAPVLPCTPPERPLLPALNYKQPQQRVPDPARFALHQAHLRSPALKTQSNISPLYIFNKGFIKPPARPSRPGRTIEKWTFMLTPSDMQSIATTVRDTIGGADAMNIDETNTFARLRCVQWPQSKSKNPPTDNLWAVADTRWMPHAYYTFNGTPLEPRIKVHYGKDLPIDLTRLLKEGENVLEFVVMASSDDTSHSNYLVAIEAMHVWSHESIKHHCLNAARVLADQVLEGIKKKLASAEDDEMTVVQSTLTIGLFDPFSQAKMCDIPVRSKACLHNDCFDLETFLNSRPRKGDASVADQWKCPICKSDARPQMLIVDGFIEDVNRQLESQGLASTQHILVQQDGSWQPKARVREGVSDNTPEPVAERSILTGLEVIDLSD